MRILVGVLYSLLPEILLAVLAGLTLTVAAGFPPRGVLAAQVLALTLVAGVLALCLLFNRSRMFFAVCTLLAACLARLAVHPAPGSTAEQLFNGLLSVLLPLDLLYAYGSADRGVFTRYGARYLAVLALQAALVALLMRLPAAPLAAALHVEFLHWEPLRYTPITQPGLLALAAGLLFFNDRLILHHSAELAAFFFAFLCAAGLLHGGSPPALTVFTAAAALAFGFAVIQDSWRMAYLDALTGLPGRRALDEQLRKLGRQYVVALLDVDHFKRFNDRYGHDVGDQVLRLVASRLQRHAAGRAFRYGGEEFCLLYPERTLAQVLPLLEELRADIASSGFDLRRFRRRHLEEEPAAKPAAIVALQADDETEDWLALETARLSVQAPREQRRTERRRTPPPAQAATANARDEGPLQITISIGASASANGRAPPATVLKRADQALYEAKQSGRNRVCSREEG